MTEPAKCPRCGTEGCPTLFSGMQAQYYDDKDRTYGPRFKHHYNRSEMIAADLACSARERNGIERLKIDALKEVSVVLWHLDAYIQQMVS